MFKEHKGMKTLAAILACSVALSGCATPLKVHPDFAQRHKEMRSLSIMPADAQVVEITFNAGQQPLPDVTKVLKETTEKDIAAVLKEKGYEVRDLRITDEQLQSDTALKDALFEMQTLYKRALEDIKQNKQKQFTYEVGSSANYFADRSGANALVMVREVGSRLSEGQKAAEAAKVAGMIATAVLLGVSAGSIQPNYTFGMEIAVIDANSGDILWYNLKTLQDNSSNPGDPKIIQKWVKEVMSTFPQSLFKAKQAEPSPAKQVEPAPKPVSQLNTAASPEQAQALAAGVIQQEAAAAKPGMSNIGPKK